MAAKARGTMKTPNRREILIVDDHPIVRQGLTQLIDQEPDLSVCGQVANAPDAMSAIENLHPDLAVVDIALRETSGMELIKDIKLRHPSLPVLTLSMHDEAIYAERALRAGAKGYIMKQEATERVVTAIRRVLAGEIYLSEDMAAKMVGKMVGRVADKGVSVVERLSDRELEVFRLVGEGYGTREMAEKLHLSIKTIETYRAHIKDKLGLEDANELLRSAIQWVNTEPRGR